MIIHLHNCFEKELIFTSNSDIISLPAKYIEDYGHETKPFDEEYKLPKGFPLCCEKHKKIYLELISWYNDFPQCCQYHKTLSENTWFNKTRYKYIVVRILKNFEYCINYINKNAHNDESLKDCKDYIDYCFHSFGVHGVGNDRFINLVKANIQFCKIVDRYKVILNEHCQSYYTDKSPQSDLDFFQINEMFQKWVDSIPNLVSFKEIKKSLLNIVPINLFAENKRQNKFTGRISFLLKTESEFINVLTHLTKDLLSKYNNNETNEVEIFKANHKAKQDKLLDKYSKNELNYVNILSKWLENEIELIKNLKSLEMNKYNINGSQNNIFINESGTQTNNTGINTESVINLITAIKNENYNIDYKKVEDLQNELKKPNPEKSKLKSLFIKISTELTTKIGVELLKPEIINLIEQIRTQL